MSGLVLYNYFRSSTSYRVRIALHFKNIDFQYQPIHLLKDGGEQHKSSYRQLNPSGEVPCLVHNGVAISQSFAIIEYLDEAFPTPSLFPKELALKAQVRQVCETINSGIHPLHNLKVLKLLDQWNHWDQPKKDEWCRHWINEGFIALTEILQKSAGQYSFGDQITAADLFLVPQIVTAERFGVDMVQYPLLDQLRKKCDLLDCFRLSHPFRQIDTPEEMRLQ